MRETQVLYLASFQVLCVTYALLLQFSLLILGFSRVGDCSCVTHLHVINIKVLKS